MSSTNASYLGGGRPRATSGADMNTSSSAVARQLAESTPQEGSTPLYNAFSRRRRSSVSSANHGSSLQPATGGRTSPSPLSHQVNASPAVDKGTSRPPPSSFPMIPQATFPFQAYGGNPDPGMRIPGYPPRRLSVDSLPAGFAQAADGSRDGHGSRDDHDSPRSRTTSNDRARPNTNEFGAHRESSPLPLPNAPFMNNRDSTGSLPGSPASSSFESLPRSPSSTSLYRGSAAQAAASSSYGSAPAYAAVPNGTQPQGIQAPIPRTSSTASFRPFMAPPSRRSSTCWTPPPNPLMPLNANASYPGGDPATPHAGSGLLSQPYTDGLILTTASKAPLPSTRLGAPLAKEDKPWMAKRQPYTLRSYFTTLFFIGLGAAGAAALCYFGYAGVPVLDESKLCLVLNEDFNNGALDEGTWNREVQLGGFGNGEFEMMTADDENLFLANNQLYIHPTLTTDILPNILDQANYTLPDCTLAQSNRSACTAVASAALGRVINPVRSARINTKGKKSIKYGKVEVRAKMPRGDWLWPAIWMLPEPVVDNNLGSHSEEGVYGRWPLSGEIDIVEARGNSPEYERQGRNYVRSGLNYGPLPSLYRQIFGWQSLKRSSYDKAFHTYTLEWTPRFIRMYVDKRITAMLEVDHIDEEKSKSKGRGGFWARGKFPKTAMNGSEEVVVRNVWQEKGGAPNAPFDQPFYLIINLAAGGTSGWFPDGKGGKPWYDGSLTAMRDFARDQENWAKTWPESREDRSLRVDSVKMWEMCR